MPFKKQVKSSQIAKFLKAELHGKDILIEKPVSIYDLSSNCLAFIKKEFCEQSIVEIINKNPNSLVICSSWYKDKIESSYIISQRAYYDFSKVLGEFFACPEPKIIIGKNCKIKSTTAIGGEGLVFRRNKKGIYERITQIGGVTIGDNVEIGSFAVIDRGILKDTIIGSNVKIDNLVFIGHNCLIGDGTIITAGTALAGGVVVGKNCFIGLNVSIRQRVKIGDNAFIGMGAVVIKDVPSNCTVFGNPAKLIRRKG